MVGVELEELLGAVHDELGHGFLRRVGLFDDRVIAGVRLLEREAVAVARPNQVRTVVTVGPRKARAALCDSRVPGGDDFPGQARDETRSERVLAGFLDPVDGLLELGGDDAGRVRVVVGRAHAVPAQAVQGEEAEALLAVGDGIDVVDGEGGRQLEILGLGIDDGVVEGDPVVEGGVFAALLVDLAVGGVVGAGFQPEDELVGVEHLHGVQFGLAGLAEPGEEPLPLGVGLGELAERLRGRALRAADRGDDEVVAPAGRQAGDRRLDAPRGEGTLGGAGGGVARWGGGGNSGDSGAGGGNCDSGAGVVGRFLPGNGVEFRFLDGLPGEEHGAAARVPRLERRRRQRKAEIERPDLRCLRLGHARSGRHDRKAVRAAPGRLELGDLDFLGRPPDQLGFERAAGRVRHDRRGPVGSLGADLQPEGDEHGVGAVRGEAHGDDFRRRHLLPGDSRLLRRTGRCEGETGCQDYQRAFHGLASEADSAAGIPLIL